MTANDKRWLQFARGHWTRDMPTQPGRYPTKTLDGHIGPDLVTYQAKDGGVVGLYPWVAFWWSEPYPAMPDCKR